MKPDRFDGLEYNHIRDNTYFTSGHTLNYRNVLQFPRYSMLDSLAAESHSRDHCLGFAILRLRNPNFVEIEYQVIAAAIRRFLHTVDGFIEKDPGNLQAKHFLLSLCTSINSRIWRRIKESTHLRATGKDRFAP
jgi:hypothetical protein